MEIAVLAAARAKSLAVGLAQRPDRQGQKHLLPQHIFKQQTVFLIIPDFGLRCCDGPFREAGISPQGPVNEVKFRRQGHLDRLDAAGARYLKFAGKPAP
jgi:hypothetical protein